MFQTNNVVKETPLGWKMGKQEDTDLSSSQKHINTNMSKEYSSLRITWRPAEQIFYNEGYKENIEQRLEA